MLPEARHQFDIRDRQRPGQGVGADRVVAETDVDRARRVAAGFHQGRDVIGGIPGRLGGLQLDRNGVEVHAVQHARHRRRIAWQAVAIGADGAGKDQGQPGRAIGQFVQRLGVGGGGIGMIDARLHRPGAVPRRYRAGAGRPAIQRLDWDAVVGLGRQPLERPLLERGADQLEPVLAAGGRKRGSKRKIVRH